MTQLRTLLFFLCVTPFRLLAGTPAPPADINDDGDLRTTVWYDDRGRWVKRRLRGRDGSTVNYACRRCQDGQANNAAP